MSRGKAIVLTAFGRKQMLLMNRPYWGRGLMAASIQAFARHVFSTLVFARRNILKCEVSESVTAGGDRRHQILHHMSREGSCRKIARTLGVAIQTFTAHRNHIFRKLHVHCRQGAVEWCWREIKRLLLWSALSSHQLGAG